MPDVPQPRGARGRGAGDIGGAASRTGTDAGCGDAGGDVLATVHDLLAGGGAEIRSTSMMLCYHACMTTGGIEYFPQPDDWTDGLLHELGYRRYAVSVFDHWLTEEEWELNPFIAFERARAAGFEAVYREQCCQFRAFYQWLFKEGVFRLTGLRTRRQVVWHDRWDRRLKKAVTAMVSDQRWGAEFYAPAEHLRVISGDVRTDTLLLEDNADEKALENVANKFGLNFIR